MVLAPEHELVPKLATPGQRAAIDAYREQAARKSELERTELQKKKTGVFTGAYALNPATNARIPIWVADYVLAGYGTGAIMAVPGQDERDWEFAKAFDLPVIRTVQPPEGFDGGAYLGDGPAINSGFLNGMRVEQAKAAMIDRLEKTGAGERRVNYKLRDWLFSRQRYWGEPFPIVFVDGKPQVVTDGELPVLLPELEEFKPSGTPEGPLATAKDWLDTKAEGKPARRETNTMPQWAGSCWYYLRFIDPHNENALVARELERYWMPVDLYVGGSEHAVLHLLYARFWHKVLYDAGFVSTPEPFQKLVHQGMMLGEPELTQYRAANGALVSASQVQDGRDARTGAELAAENVTEDAVEKRGDKLVLRVAPEIAVDSRAFKMSKSRGNVVNPDDIIGSYGADSLRLYEMFMSPLEQVKPWNTRGVEGTFRFLNRAWRLIAGGDGDGADDAGVPGGVRIPLVDDAPTREQSRTLHQTIAKVTEDLEAMRFNTAISALMEFVNAAYKWPSLPRSAAESFTLLLAPLAPHLAEELWQRLGHAESLVRAPWPVADPALLAVDEIELTVQVAGKLRDRVRVPADADQPAALAAALASENVKKHLGSGAPRRVIYVPGRLINLVP
jgi:leucyl-tRNA synthetase